MTEPLRTEAHDQTNSVGALIVAGIVGAMIVLLIFAHAAARVARYQGAAATPPNWSLSPLAPDTSDLADDAHDAEVPVSPTGLQQIGAEAGD